METVRVNGLDVAYWRAGGGPPVALVHGAIEDSRTWTPQIEALSAEFTVVAWDEPGVGQSSDLPPKGFTLADYAECLAGVIESVGVGSAHVVGLSWGSTVALEHRLCGRIRVDRNGGSCFVSGDESSSSGWAFEDEVFAGLAVVVGDADPGEVFEAGVVGEGEAFDVVDFEVVEPQPSISHL